MNQEKINYDKRISSGGSAVIGKIKLPLCEIKIVKGYYSSDWKTVSIGLKAEFKDGSYLDHNIIAYTKHKNWKKKVRERIDLIKKNTTELKILNATIQHNRKQMWKHLKVIEENRNKIAKLFGAEDFFIAKNNPIPFSKKEVKKDA